MAARGHGAFGYGSIVMFTPPQEKINQGLDIQGGLSVVLTAHNNDGSDVSTEDMESSRAIIENRVNALGASEAVVQIQGNDQILVQIPGLSDTEEALNTIGKTGKLEFARLDSFTDSDVKTKIQNGQYGTQGTVTDAFGNSFPSEKVEHLKVEEGTYTPIITGSNLEKVDVGQASQTSTDYAVNLRLDSEGTKAFAEATEDLAPTKGQIVIILDGEVQSAPAVQSVISDGNVSITGGYTLDAAKQMKTVLESGSLPVSFEYAQSQVVGPTLGQDALQSGVLVALIGLVIVMIYLLVFYEGLGIITAAAMAVFAAIYLGILALLSAFGLFSLSRRHRRRRFDHRHGGRLLHPDARALPRGNPHGSKRARRVYHGRPSRHSDLDRRRPRDARLRAHAVLPGERLGQGLRHDACFGHRVRHHHDGAVQGARSSAFSLRSSSRNIPSSGAWRTASRLCLTSRA